MPLIIGSVILIGAAGLTYYLFFSPVPLVDTVSSSRYENVSIFSEARLDIEAVTDSPVWSSINRESTVPALNLQVISRKQNPFQSF